MSKNEKKIVSGLSIVSSNIFLKRKSNCFSNQALLRYLHQLHVDEVELVGVDGNYCVGSSALHGKRKGLNVLFNESCVGIKDMKKFGKTKELLSKEGIIFIT